MKNWKLFDGEKLLAAGYLRIPSADPRVDLLTTLHAGDRRPVVVIVSETTAGDLRQAPSVYPQALFAVAKAGSLTPLDLDEIAKEVNCGGAIIDLEVLAERFRAPAKEILNQRMALNEFLRQFGEVSRALFN